MEKMVFDQDLAWGVGLSALALKACPGRRPRDEGPQAGRRGTCLTPRLLAEDPCDSKPWGPGDRGARRGLTPTPTSPGGRASALSPGGPRCLGEGLGGAHPSPAQLYFLHGKERASGISELSCALMPLGRLVMGWVALHVRRSPPQAGKPLLTLAPCLSGLSPCCHVQHQAWYHFCICPDALVAKPGPFSGVSPT